MAKSISKEKLSELLEGLLMVCDSLREEIETADFDEEQTSVDLDSDGIWGSYVLPFEDDDEIDYDDLMEESLNDKARIVELENTIDVLSDRLAFTRSLKGLR